jgi:TatD DNase family protein
MNYWIDTHAHIYSKEFKADREEMLQRCRDQKVDRIFMPNVDETTIDDMLEVESRHPQCHAMMGLHPCSVKQDFERELYIVEDWLSKRKFSAIGEIGTDLYWDKTFWDQQCEAFRIQIEWAKKFDLPVVIHCRESLDKTLALLEPLQDGSLTGVFHCFSGSVAQAEKIARLNFFLGLGGCPHSRTAAWTRYCHRYLLRISFSKPIAHTLRLFLTVESAMSLRMSRSSRSGCQRSRMLHWKICRNRPRRMRWPFSRYVHSAGVAITSRRFEIFVLVIALWKSNASPSTRLRRKKRAERL